MTPADLTMLLLIAGVALAVVWITLPFAIFGVKPLLRELIEEVRKTNALLERLTKSVS